MTGIQLTDELSSETLAGLTPSQQVVYAVLRTDGPCTYRELEMATNRSRDTLSQATSELRRRGLLEDLTAPAHSGAHSQFRVNAPDS